MTSTCSRFNFYLQRRMHPLAPRSIHWRTRSSLARMEVSWGTSTLRAAEL